MTKSERIPKVELPGNNRRLTGRAVSIWGFGFLLAALTRRRSGWEFGIRHSELSAGLGGLAPSVLIVTGSAMRLLSYRPKTGRHSRNCTCEAARAAHLQCAGIAALPCGEKIGGTCGNRTRRTLLA